jgi:hypothetical protein
MSIGHVLADSSQHNRDDDAVLNDLGRRLSVVRDRVRGVAFGYHPGFYLFGPPGTSKTHTVLYTLRDAEKPIQYEKGHVTPMGLFDLLEEHHDKVIVLDDVSYLLTQRQAFQILLAALGNSPEGTATRVISYKRQGSVRRVNFTGGIICISNLEFFEGPLLEAFRSRVHCLRFAPSDDELAALMRQIASKGWPQNSPKITPTECGEIAEFLIQESRRLGRRLDLRVLVDKAFPDYHQFSLGEADTDWRDLITSTLEQRSSQLRHTALTVRNRTQQLQVDRNIVEEIIQEL